MNQQTRSVHRIHMWQKWLIYPVYLLLRLWNQTLKLTIDTESLKIVDMQQPAMIFLWHNRLFVAEKLYRTFRRGRKVCGLVSASRDGAWLSGLFDWMGIRAIRGSSSWRGRQSLKELKEHVYLGYDVVVTPDGPRGPKYRFKKGSVLLAQKEIIPVILASIQYESYWELKSWDAFQIPKPFSKVSLTCRHHPDLNALGAEDDQLVEMLEKQLCSMRFEHKDTGNGSKKHD